MATKAVAVGIVINALGLVYLGFIADQMDESTKKYKTYLKISMGLLTGAGMYLNFKRRGVDKSMLNHHTGLVKVYQKKAANAEKSESVATEFKKLINTTPKPYEANKTIDKPIISQAIGAVILLSLLAPSLSDSEIITNISLILLTLASGAYVFVDFKRASVPRRIKGVMSLAEGQRIVETGKLRQALATGNISATV
jgi:hypothetical protein